MKVVFTPRFERNIKKLHASEIKSLNQAIKEMMVNPLLGDAKKGDLAGVRVYKYQHLQQTLLLAYAFDSSQDQIVLMAQAPTRIFTEI